MKNIAFSKAAKAKSAKSSKRTGKQALRFRIKNHKAGKHNHS